VHGPTLAELAEGVKAFVLTWQKLFATEDTEDTEKLKNELTGMDRIVRINGRGSWFLSLEKVVWFYPEYPEYPCQVKMFGFLCLVVCGALSLR
jgi:hypothetical protein